MLKRERQAYIVQQGNLQNKVLSNAFSTKIDILDDTIRRYLTGHTEKEKFIKLPAVTASASFSNIHYPSQKAYIQNNNKIITQKAANRAVVLPKYLIFNVLSKATSVILIFIFLFIN